MGFTGNSRGVRVVLLVLLGLFALGALGYCSRSEAEETGLSVSFGAGLAGSEHCFTSLLLAQSLAEERWLSYLVTHGDASACRSPEEPIRANIGAGILRTTHLGKWSIGFGAGLREHGDVLVGPESVELDDPPRTSDRTQFVAAILIRRRLGSHLVVDLLHNSTGGSTRFNRGFNAVTLGVRF